MHGFVSSATGCSHRRVGKAYGMPGGDDVSPRKRCKADFNTSGGKNDGELELWLLLCTTSVPLNSSPCSSFASQWAGPGTATSLVIATLDLTCHPLVLTEKAQILRQDVPQHPHRAVPQDNLSCSAPSFLPRVKIRGG